jgi:hypothetical protein
VAKAAGWTLQKANSTTSQEANINKTLWFQVMRVSLDMEAIFQVVSKFL